MAEKTLHDFSIPSATNVATRPNVDVGDVNFELKSSLINMMQASPFYEKPNEDTNAHLQNFLELCETVIIRGVTADAIKLYLFPFSLLGKAKQWFYKDKEAVNMWNKCSTAFLANKARMESIPKAWERLQEYILACPHHGWTNGLSSKASRIG
jgi:hypothetical protein